MYQLQATACQNDNDSLVTLPYRAGLACNPSFNVSPSFHCTFHKILTLAGSRRSADPEFSVFSELITCEGVNLGGCRHCGTTPQTACQSALVLKKPCRECLSRLDASRNGPNCPDASFHWQGPTDGDIPVVAESLATPAICFQLNAVVQPPQVQAISDQPRHRLQLAQLAAQSNMTDVSPVRGGSLAAAQCLCC